MMFRSSFISPFCKFWEDAWKEWIVPKPFVNHPNPFATVADDLALCLINQFALGQAIFKFIPAAFDDEVQVLSQSRN